MSRGYMGKLLFVDLSSGVCKEEELGEELCRDFMGGYGIGVKILYERMKPRVDPLGPDNLLGFLTGPLTGTPTMCSGRFVVVCKSPLTGTWGDANCGGDFGPNLKFAGFDGVFFSGASQKPVYLCIENGKPELKDAGNLWGKDCLETEDILKKAHGKESSIACIGPSGEQLSLLAAIINEKGRAAGRSGVGAVMGSKKLKAIAVKGNQKVPMADEDKAIQLRRTWMKQVKGLGEVLSKYGTAGLTEASAMCGDSPVKNWAGAGEIDFPNAKRISDDAVIAEQERKYGCWQCPLRCGGHMKTKAGRAEVSHKPEYETLCMAGTLCLNDDLESIIRFNDICNIYGIDTISAGVAVGFAIECYENGILTKADTGMELRWGDGNAIVALTEKIARREGIGALLADGVKHAAEKIGKGSEQYAVHVQGQELPAHDPRFIPALSLTYRMDGTPGRHTQGGRSWLMGVDFLTDPREDKYDFTNTGELQKKATNMLHIVNSAGICLFAYATYPTQFLPDFLTAVTGQEYTLDSCLDIGERIGTLRHLFNLREGLNPLKYFMNPRAVGKPPLKEGPLANVTIDDDTMIKDYLKSMDWDLTTTEPSAKKLQELGLSQLVKEK
ncbi:MAG: aldehyde ferredoxin oxidoreductase family protein [Dehalococcoidales bacterium]